MEHLVAMLDRAADAAPDRIAFVREGHEAASITYAGLRARTTRLADGLARRFAPGERVPLLLDDAVDAVIAFFACQRAALIAVPMALPGKRAERIESFSRIVAACGARQGLVSDDFAARTTGHLADLPVLGFSQTLGEGKETASMREPAADAIAYLQFTSGSVGTPKGVIVKQSNVLANLRQIASRFRLAPGLATVTWYPSFQFAPGISAYGLQRLLSILASRFGFSPATDDRGGWARAFWLFQPRGELSLQCRAVRGHAVTDPVMVAMVIRDISSAARAPADALADDPLAVIGLAQTLHAAKLSDASA
ncbi:acyl-CoA synthetase (AMP-forming)/AMP-acid ligase II [Luteibacter sp. Sphag1AF]|uniref:AMP-binding protein n=1 Tax=Luteibacter sp. Sphag1AF TaxID=2587031 RepID=UPI00160E8EED|nr:AMP-binding protein [Luteibacter sp. Sphag1AF]MBB3228193.1 acyl-CoA synthetase (AMP-forming)/AMP-acid ligase II [Luteibacter sp. Sphag1AF]